MLPTDTRFMMLETDNIFLPMSSSKRGQHKTQIFFVVFDGRKEGIRHNLIRIMAGYNYMYIFAKTAKDVN